MAGIEQAYVEKRRSRRLRVLKRGKALYHNNLTVFDCLIRDVSDGGARLVLDHAETLPSEFRLGIVGDGVTKEVRVVWRRADHVGVEFITR